MSKTQLKKYATISLVALVAMTAVNRVVALAPVKKLVTGA